MYSLRTSSDLARLDFAKRLHQALDRIGFDHSPTKVAEAFNRRSGADSVSVHGARKWLTGDSIPTQPRLVLLAHWLRVDVAWLRFGDSAGFLTEDIARSNELESLRSDLDLLSERERKIVRGLVDALFKTRKLTA